MRLQSETTHQEALHELAALIRRQKLDSMATMALEAIEPVAMIASQIALFTQPFIPTKGWQRYMNALGSEASWHTLRRMLDQQEC